jgi:hypothetical protein
MDIKKFHVFMRLCVCLTLGVGALAACGDDDDGSAPDASVVADAGSDGGDVDGGDVDAGVDLGVADLGPLEAGALDLGEADAGTSDGGAPDCTPTHLLVTTSDFVTGGLATYALDTGTIALAPAPTADQDTLPVRAGCDTYLVEGGTGAVRRQAAGAPLTTAVSIDVDPAGTASDAFYVSTPQAVVEAGGAAFVTRFAQSSAVRIDPGAGTVLGEVDFTPLAAAMDPDSVDMSRVLLNGGRLIVALGRFYFSPSFELLQAAPSLLALVDPATGALLDADAATPGTQGIELPVGNPGAMARLDDDVVLVACLDDGFDETDGVLVSVDVPSGNVTRTAATEAMLGGFKGLATTDAGRVYLAAGGALHEMRADSGEVLDTPVPASVGVTSFVVQGDRAYLVTNAGLRIWSLATGTEETTAPITFGSLPIYGIALAR